MADSEVTGAAKEAPNHAGVVAVVHDGCPFWERGEANGATPALVIQEGVELVAAEVVPGLDLLPAANLGTAGFAIAPPPIGRRGRFMVLASGEVVPAGAAYLHRGIWKEAGSLMSKRRSVWRFTPCSDFSSPSTVSVTSVAPWAGAGGGGILTTLGGLGWLPHISTPQVLVSGNGRGALRGLLGLPVLQDIPGDIQSLGELGDEELKHLGAPLVTHE
jgi:hypothetical protein